MKVKNFHWNSKKFDIFGLWSSFFTWIDTKVYFIWKRNWFKNTQKNSNFLKYFKRHNKKKFANNKCATSSPSNFKWSQLYCKTELILNDASKMIRSDLHFFFREPKKFKWTISLCKKFYFRGWGGSVGRSDRGLIETSSKNSNRIWFEKPIIWSRSSHRCYFVENCCVSSDLSKSHAMLFQFHLFYYGFRSNVVWLANSDVVGCLQSFLTSEWNPFFAINTNTLEFFTFTEMITGCAFIWAHPIGYLIAICVQTRLAWLTVNDSNSFWTFILAVLLYTNTAPKDLKRNLKNINDNTKEKRLHSEIVVHFSESLNHSNWCLKR